MARVIKPGARIVRALVVDARAHAASIVQDATREAAQIRAEAAAAGHREGDARAAATLARAAAARDEALARTEGDVREIALAAAARIVEGHVALGGAEVAAIVTAALERARRARQVRVRLCPDDAAALAALPEPVLPAAVVIAPDPSLSRGDCVVESDLGTIDARVGTKLDALRDALRNAG